MNKIRMLTVVMLVCANCFVLEARAQDDQNQTTSEQVKKIDVDADIALNALYEKTPQVRELAAEAKGVLVLPSVRAGGAVIGVEYGKGVLRERGQPSAYYNAITGSVGAQLGYESKSVILLFMTQQALNHFRNTKGWTAGVDGSIALAKTGASGKLDTNTGRASIIGFVVTKQGLMFDLSLTGTHFIKAPV